VHFTATSKSCVINGSSINSFVNIEKKRKIYLCALDENEADGRGALKTLDNITIKSRFVRDCLVALATLAAQNIMNLEWFPEHQDSEENRRADHLAKKGDNSSRRTRTHLLDSIEDC
jgi:hypothetical protein